MKPWQQFKMIWMETEFKCISLTYNQSSDNRKHFYKIVSNEDGINRIKSVDNIIKRKNDNDIFVCVKRIMNL